MFAVEIARRNASERSLWIVVSGSFFSYDTQKALFVQNYPTRAYKDAIELAGRRLNLRHVFGIERLQNQYDTIYLQLGFTKLGFTSRLPEWLVGHTSTLAIQHLLGGPMRQGVFYIDFLGAFSILLRIVPLAAVTVVAAGVRVIDRFGGARAVFWLLSALVFESSLPTV